MASDDYVHLDFEEIVAETEKALLVRFEPMGGETLETWVPLSQIADPDDYRKGDVNGTISITRWLAKQKGIDVEYR